jgi:hypothetical protein
MEDADYCIVRFRGAGGVTDLLIRRKYQWDAQRLRHRWEYVAEGLTKEQAMQFIKLFEGS